jgi:predicted permease
MLVAMMLPGYILKKKKMLAEDSVGSLVNILMYVALPFLTFSSFLKKSYEPELLRNMGITLVLAVFLLIAVYFISRLCFSFTKEDPARRACLTAGYLNNCSFMGIPVMLAFFPNDSEPIMYIAVFSAVFNFLVWTLGVYTITGDKKHINLKNGLANPPTIALLLAMPFFFLKVPMAPYIMSTVDFLGNMTSPLSMMVIGIRLADINLGDLFNSAKVYLAVFIKLIIAPLFTFAVLLLLRLFVPIDRMLFITIYAVMAMPCASSVILFSELFGGDSGTAVKCILLSSILSVLTIPVLMLLTDFL